MFSATASPLRPLAFSPDANGNYVDRPYCALPGIGVSGTGLLSHEETGGAFSLVSAVLEPGAALLPLVSHTETSIYYVVEGSPVIYLGGKMDVGGTNGNKGAFVSPGAICEINNDRLQSARLLILTMPTLSNHRPAPYRIGPETGQYINLTDNRGRFIVGDAQTNGALLWWDNQTDCGSMVPPHIHAAEDETFYVVSGKYVIGAEGAGTFEVGPGSVVFGPRSIAHTWQCVSPEGGQLQILVTPGASFEAFAQTMSQRDIFPSRDMGDPVLAAQFMALTAQHHIQMLPPPAAS